MRTTLATISMIATIVNATIALSNSVVNLTTRKHKYDIDLGVNLDYKSDLTMLFDSIYKYTRRVYNKLFNLISQHTIVTGYIVEISLVILFLMLGYNPIYIEIFGLAFLMYRGYLYYMENYHKPAVILLTA